MRRKSKARWYVGGIGLLAMASVCHASFALQTATKEKVKTDGKENADAAPGKTSSAPTGTLHLWEDRGSLSPQQVFWGAASHSDHPETQLPAPPFSDFEQDNNGTSPKCKVKDKNGVKWTVKFGEEVHADVSAPRLAWALGYRTEDSYYIKTGKIEGITSATDLGRCQKYINMDGTFADARFKGRGEGEIVKGPHDKSDQTDDADWDERKNPGLPPEQLSGLLMLEVMVHNWDSQPKNNRIMELKTANGPQLWYLVSDWGASFGQMKTKGNLTDYKKETSFIKSVDANSVYFKFDDIIKGMEPVHTKIPLAHAQWFGKQLDKLTDDHLRAAFEAAYATDEAYKSYAQNVSAEKGAFDPLTWDQIEGYVKAFRAKIDEFKAKVH